MNAGLILFLIFILCLVIGVPVSISLSVASLAAVVFGGLPASSTAIAQRIFGGLQSSSIMAIAFFVLAGNLMTKGGISRRIVDFADCLVAVSYTHLDVYKRQHQGSVFLYHALSGADGPL